MKHLLTPEHAIDAIVVFGGTATTLAVVVAVIVKLIQNEIKRRRSVSASRAYFKSK